MRVAPSGPPGVKIGDREFRPGLWPSLAFLVLLPVLLRLGFWQLDRAAEKQALLDALEAANRRAPVALETRLADADALRYRKVTIRGEYLVGREFLLDNQVHDGRAGYHVLTPLRVAAESEVCVLIDRGWIPLGRDRHNLPPVSTPEGPRSVQGTVWLSWREAFHLGDQARSGRGWPAVVQWVDLGAMSAELPCRLAPLVVRLARPAADGFVLDWPLPSIQPEKSTSYAIQWFALAAALALIYIFVNLKKIAAPSQDGKQEQHD